jgi:hypothetical protein
MTIETLPLLAWRPPCLVLVFPMDRRVGKVRHVAQTLSGKTGDDAQIYWKQVVTASRRQLSRVGLSDEGVDAEINALFRAVQSEMTRQFFENNGGAS